MDTSSPTTGISVVAPVTPAFDRMKEVLFRPFDLGRWLAIGFCAFLAKLGEAGGGGGGGANFGDSKKPEWANFNETWSEGVRFLNDNLIWIIPSVVGVVLLVVTLLVLVLWLSSRGRFMFLDNVATNRAEVIRPWQEFAGPANSLFRFRLMLMVLGGFLMVLGLGVGFAGAFPMLRQSEINAIGLGVVGSAVGFMLVLGLFLVVVAKLTQDLVVPVMWLRRCDWRTGWSQIGGLLRSYPGVFFLYLVFQLLLALAVGILVIVVVLLTCCMAGCLLAIPYLGTVFLLPVLVFFRAYSAYFLAQFGPQFDTFRGGSASAAPVGP